MEWFNPKWVLVDKSNQTTENGIVFADARFGTTGGTALVVPRQVLLQIY